MIKVKQSQLLSIKTPVVFTDGTKIYKKFAKEFITHKRGFFIMAPSGVGKTYFIDRQKKKHWVDGDTLWKAAKAHPKDGWWLEKTEVIDELDQKCDVITMEAKKLGFWIMGASNNWLKPDAVVIPNWSKHKKYIIHREKYNYDGGFKSDQFEGLLSWRKNLLGWRKKGVPIFKTVPDATAYLESIYYGKAKKR